MGADKSKLAAKHVTDPEAVWNRHGLHPGSIITTTKVGAGSGLPKMPNLVKDAAEQGGNFVRFVAISDTHNRHQDLEIPPGDVLVHSGDFTVGGTVHEVMAFNAWLGTLPHKHKIVIAGNHDFLFDETVCDTEQWANLQRHHSKEEPEDAPSCSGRAAAKYLTNCTYLCGESISVQGVEVYGVPHQPRIKVLDHKMAFNAESEEELAGEFAKIPDTTDVLLTHGPPNDCGRIDRLIAGFAVGSTALRARIEELGAAGRLQYCVCGHLHEGKCPPSITRMTARNLIAQGYGAYALGRVVCLNAASVSCYYHAAHPPIVFDVAVPQAASSDHA